MIRDKLGKMKLALGLAGALALPINGAMAQAKPEIVLGASIPLSGVMAATAAGYHAAMQDYLKYVNDNGGLNGHPLRYVAEDTAYKVDVSVAVFNKITASNNVRFYYGDSTGFSKTITPEVARRGNILMTGTSFATELNDPVKFPHFFMAGPDYSEMVKILLRHIATEKPKARVALVYSDNEFGRDPIAAAEAYAKDLGLTVAATLPTPIGSVDVSTEVLKLRRANPDYTIFHGYVLAPIPEFISQAKNLGMKTRFMGTLWSMDLLNVERMGAGADGFMGVMPYRYHFDTEPAPMLDVIRKIRPGYQSVAYMQGWLSSMLLVEAAKRTLDAGKELTGDNMKAALNSIKNWDSGGIIGVPVTVEGNSIPVGRVYQYDAGKKTMVPVSGWIDLKQELKK